MHKQQPISDSVHKYPCTTMPSVWIFRGQILSRGRLIEHVMRVVCLFSFVLGGLSEACSISPENRHVGLQTLFCFAGKPARSGERVNDIVNFVISV